VVPLEVITGAGGLLVGGAGVWIALSSMWERRQPIIVAHEVHGRTYDSDARAWFSLAYLRNESGPSAFNVRFGVEYGGVRFPYKMTFDDPDEGNYQTVVPAGERLPEEEERSLSILLTSEDIWSAAAHGRGDLDQGRVYWCRYENARGQTWETRNPGGRSAKLEIRRVWFVRRTERREAAARGRLRGSETWEAAALAARQD
jgi:hypothetical protein